MSRAMFLGRRAVTAVGVVALAAVHALAAPTTAAADGTPVTITVDRVDPANQQPYPPFNRLFEYNDFFSRSVSVHRGDLVNFQAQPFTFHIVALASDEAGARQAYPMVELDTDDAPAIGTGLPKIIFGDGNFPVTGGSLSGGGVISYDKGVGPPVCGVVQYRQPPCTFRGGGDVEIIGPTPGWNLEQQPATLDQYVRIDAPPGQYVFFDVNHPGARGTLTVVPDDRPVTTQAQVDAASALQLAEDQAQGLAVESLLNENPVVIGRPGRRTFYVVNGAGTPNNHVGIDEMMPNRPINAVPGDRVTFVWANPNSFHTVGFAPSQYALPAPFGFDCGGGVYRPEPTVFNVPTEIPCIDPQANAPEFIGDPGNAPSGSELRSPDQIVNSGLLIGSGYGVSPIAHTWSVRITSRTANGSYHYFDAIRPWASGVINVS
jgi:hypothetical protein